MKNLEIGNSKPNYDIGNYEIIYNTGVLKSNLRDYNDVQILVRGHITVTIQVAYKTCAPFIRYITKKDGTTIDDAEDLHLIMLM